MPTTIAIESKPVVVFGITTPYEHLYLVKRVTDASGKVLDERVIRGNVASDGNLETQVNIPLALSEDARGSATLAQRHHTVLDLGGRDPEEVWRIMAQHAVNIDKAELQYGVEAFDILDFGGEVNSNTVIASALHSVGINLAQNLPTGIGPEDVPLYSRIDAMFVNDALIGRAQNDIIFGGVGGDTINGAGGDDRLYGEIGTDSLIGGAGNDRLDGGSGADRLNGGDGRDVYYIDNSNDHVIEVDISTAADIDLVVSTFSFSIASRSEMRGIEQLKLSGTGNLTAGGNNLDNLLAGTNGANKLSGGQGDDKLVGRNGNDSLYGSIGSDTLLGGSGDDYLAGGTNRDIFRGGAGSDTFAYKSVAESYAGFSSRDQIVDFQSIDRIDLGAIDANLLVSGNQSFTFIGSAAFTGAGQLRFELDGAGNTIVQADVNGDLNADSEIFLKGYTQALNSGDFIL